MTIGADLFGGDKLQPMRQLLQHVLACTIFRLSPGRLAGRLSSDESSTRPDDRGGMSSLDLWSFLVD